MMKKEVGHNFSACMLHLLPSATTLPSSTGRKFCYTKNIDFSFFKLLDVGHIIKESYGLYDLKDRNLSL